MRIICLGLICLASSVSYGLNLNSSIFHSTAQDLVVSQGNPYVLCLEGEQSLDTFGNFTLIGNMAIGCSARLNVRNFSVQGGEVKLITLMHSYISSIQVV